MAARSTMAAIITRVRGLINDPAGAGQLFTDDQIQDVLDGRPRQDVRYLMLRPSESYSGSTIQFLDYYAKNLTDWEDGSTFWQLLSTQVTPATSEPIAGHWVFATSTYPPVHIVGKTYCVYRAAADLLEMRAVMVSGNFDVVVGGQTFRQSQEADALEKRVRSYRMKQRLGSIGMTRSDLSGPGESSDPLGPRAIDYMTKP